MADANDLVKLIKKAAVDANMATKPVQIRFGEVKNISPLQILIDQKITLKSKQLILSQNVTDHDVLITINSEDGWGTQSYTHTHTHVIHDSYTGGGSAESHTHTHNHTIIADKLKIKIHNGLVVGDKVILIRQQNGQKYIVMDKIG